MTVVGFVCFATPPPGQTLHLVDLTVVAPLIVAQGHVALDRCTLQGPPPLSVTNASAHLQQCTLTAPPGFISYVPALRAVDGKVTAVDSTCNGVGGLGLALQLTRSAFHGSHLMLHAPQATNVVMADAESTIWLADSTVTGAAAGCPIAASAGRLARCSLTPGCSGVPLGALVGVRRPLPLQVGAPFGLDFSGEPGESIAVFASASLGASQSSLIEQPLWLAPTDTWLAVMLTGDALGHAQMVWNVPAVPGLVNTSLWFQGLGLAGPLLQASPPAGGLLQ